MILSYVSVKDSNATPEGTFYALSSTDAGNNTNWTFPTSAVVVHDVAIQDCIGSAGTTWYANGASVNLGNNTNWIFENPISASPTTRNFLVFF